MCATKGCAIQTFAVASDCVLDDEQGILPMRVRGSQHKMRNNDNNSNGNTHGAMKQSKSRAFEDQGT